jgi:hypothetical protein
MKDAAKTIKKFKNWKEKLQITYLIITLHLQHVKNKIKQTPH